MEFVTEQKVLILPAHNWLRKDKFNKLKQGRLQKGSQDQALLPQCVIDKDQSIIEKQCKF